MRRVALVMSMDQVNALCEQLVKAVTIMMDPSSTQRYRLEALKVAGVCRPGPAPRPSPSPSRTGAAHDPGRLPPTRPLDLGPQPLGALPSPLSAPLTTPRLLCSPRLPFSRDALVPSSLWPSHRTTTSHCPLLPPRHFCLLFSVPRPPPQPAAPTLFPQTPHPCIPSPSRGARVQPVPNTGHILYSLRCTKRFLADPLLTRPNRAPAPLVPLYLTPLHLSITHFCVLGISGLILTPPPHVFYCVIFLGYFAQR